MPEIRLLGELQVVRDGRAVPLPASKKTRALLGYLAATGRPQLRERLCTLLWDGPDDPRAALRWSLTKLRPLVDDARHRRLVADREHVELLTAGALRCDLGLIREAVPGGVLAGVSRASTEALRDVSPLLRGELLEGLDLPDCYGWDEWLRSERETVRRLAIGILATLVERSVAKPDEALGFARARLAFDPLDESAHAEVIRLMLALDRRSEAIGQYASCVRVLERELGRAPSRELEALRIAMHAAPAIVMPSHVPTRPALDAARVETPVVGRRQERARLHRFLSDDTPRVVVLVGDPGIGKTRLLEDLVEQARAAAIRVFRGRSVEAESVRPYGAWLDALGAAAPLQATAEQDRAQLFGAIGRWLGSAPTLVVIDDIQWIDEASAALLHFLAREHPTLKIATAARPGELADNRSGVRLLRSLTRERLVEQLGLSVLDAKETAALAVAYAPGVDAERVVAESGGHPLFAVEIARALARGETSWSSLETLIGERLELLDDAARELVPWAAVLGRAFTGDVIAAITGQPLADLDRAIADLEQRAIFRVAASEWDFAHDLIRAAAYARISTPRRRLMHLQIARSLVAQRGDPGEIAVEVSHHAGLGGDSALCAEACLAAGERCVRMFAHDEATVYANRGLSHVARLAGPQRARLQVELLCLAHVADTRWQHTEQIGRDLRRAVLDAQAAGCHGEAARGHNVLSHIQYRANDLDGAATSSLDAAERARAADPIPMATSLAFSAQCLALLDREMPRVEALTTEAAALLRGSGVEVIELPVALGLLRQHEGDDDAAVSLVTRAAEIAEARGVHWQTAQCRARAALIELSRGRYDAARKHAEVLRALAPKMGINGDIALGDVIDAIAAIADGGPASLADAPLERLRVADAPVLFAPAAGCVAEILLARGALEAAAPHARSALAAAQQMRRPSDLAIAHARVARISLIEGDRDALATQRAAMSELAAGNLSAHARAAIAAAMNR